MQIPILNGIKADGKGGASSSYPVNLVPVVLDTGVSAGYLRPADGIIANGTGPGVSRGGILWNNVVYRVMGTKLVKVLENGTIETLGDVGGSGLVSLDYSFDRLIVVSSNNLFYWDGASLTQVTDTDLGVALDGLWVDGYTMTTDGSFIVVTDINDPTAVNPLKYGSSEVDPDPIKALLKVRNEVHALNRHTIEVFDNIGGSLFPFQRIDGAQIQKGVVGTHACAVYLETIAFVGGGRNESPCVYMGASGGANKISTHEIDSIIGSYSEDVLSLVEVEARNDRSSQLLYIHLPDKTLVYDAMASQGLGQSVWFILQSGVSLGKYRGRHFVYGYKRWNVADSTSSQIGYFDELTGSQFGEVTLWEFSTQINYNESRGAIINELELVGFNGAIELGKEPQIATSYSLDGRSWSQDRFISAGKIGETLKRLRWLRQGKLSNMRIQRFRGDSSAHVSFARLEANIEPLAY